MDSVLEGYNGEFAVFIMGNSNNIILYLIIIFFNKYANSRSTVGKGQGAHGAKVNVKKKKC